MSIEEQLNIYYSMLREFDYKKNGREETIKFLIFILNNIVNVKEV